MMDRSSEKNTQFNASQSELPDTDSWPQPPNEPGAEKDFATILYQAQIDTAKARYLAEIEEVKARWRDEATELAERRKQEAARQDVALATEDKFREAVHNAYLDVAKSTLERSLQRANFVTAAAGTIGTSYAALLALVYSVSSTNPNPLPARGIVPAVFLGLSFLLSAIYVGFIRSGTTKGHFIPSGVGGQIEERRMVFFLYWAIGGAMRRAWALRAAVVSLGVGVALIPLPFLQVPRQASWFAMGAGGLVFIIWLGYEIIHYVTRPK